MCYLHFHLLYVGLNLSRHLVAPSSCAWRLTDPVMRWTPTIRQTFTVGTTKPENVQFLVKQDQLLTTGGWLRFYGDILLAQHQYY